MHEKKQDSEHNPFHRKPFLTMKEQTKGIETIPARFTRTSFFVRGIVVLTFLEASAAIFPHTSFKFYPLYWSILEMCTAWRRFVAIM